MHETARASAHAADALDTLLKAHVLPADPRVRTLAALIHLNPASPPPPAPFTHPHIAPFHAPPFYRSLSFEAARNAARAIAPAYSYPAYSYTPPAPTLALPATPSAASAGDRLSAFAAAAAAAASTAPGAGDATDDASVVFRVRAQVAAYRALARSSDPPPEVLIASCGGHRPRPALAPALEAAPCEDAREKRVAARVAARASEIRGLRQGMPADLRAAAESEARMLGLVGRQKVVRESVIDEIRVALKVPEGVELAGGFQRFARLAPPMVAERTVEGAGGWGGVLGEGGEARVRRLENEYRREKEEEAMMERARYAAATIVHAATFRTWQYARRQREKKLFKEVERYFRDKVREDDRKKKKEQHDRLRALRNNDEDEYMELLRNTKNERLLQVIRQTDDYLAQLGAKVEAQKEEPQDGVTSDGRMTVDKINVEDVAGGAEGGKSIEAMRAGRNQYYTVTHRVKEVVEQPSILVGGQLKPYQIDGLQWMVSLYNNGLNGILADEMGLGKTIQTLSLITYLVEFKNNEGPYLIVVPLSTVSNWVRELEKWTPSLDKIVYRGAPDKRKAIQQEMSNSSYSVVLTTYEFVVKDKGFLGRIQWKYIIIDEGHRMKNAECKLALTLGSKYKTKNRILLTGTPLQNNLTELWALLNFLLPTIFSSADTFETWFNAPFQASSLSGGSSAELNEEEQLLVISRLHQVLRPFMLRRLKSDVLKQLPDKVESVLRCDMSVWQKVLYKQMTSNVGITSSGNVRTFNNIVMQLKKICNHPYLFYSEEELMSVPRDCLIRAAGKFEMLEHALTKLKATGHRVLLFSQMTHALDYLEYFLSGMGIKHMRLDGTTKADDRQVMLEDFNAPDSEYFIFLLSTRAGGLGLNLQTADTVFIFDSDWNPMMDLQAQDRAHRIGQTKEVRVFRLVTASSVEEKILERANQKLEMDAQIIQAGQFNNKSSDIDRTAMLKEILQSQAQGTGDGDAVHSLDELNILLARSDEELELFQDIDRERLAKDAENGRSRLMVDEADLPSWVLYPGKSKEEMAAEEVMDVEYDNNGRSRRKRTEVSYNDGLTDREWAAAVERDGDADLAAFQKRRRVDDRANEDVEKLNNESAFDHVGVAKTSGMSNGN